MPKIADYDKNNYDYETYWSDKNVRRDYEDQAERIAIGRLLPRHGSWFCDLGAGFGRLFDTYENRFDHIILADYSLENMKKAKKRINPDGKKPGIYFFALNAYHLPFSNDSLDNIMSVRMLHHIEDPQTVIREIKRVLSVNGIFLLEYANKKHFWAVIKYFLGKGKINPFKKIPEAQGDLFYNFHPHHIHSLFHIESLAINKVLSVSNLRHKIFKKILPRTILLALESIFQVSLSPITFGPSIFIKTQKSGRVSDNRKPAIQLKDIVICPLCLESLAQCLPKTDNGEVKCGKCQSIYPIIDGIYDFRV
ncbi:class I SAM-dependent methyltransferase [Candidatus Microgenomates bacterium]|nr:class I SAM-dependent methyltransferase [Candidatus Microgenomates bacterium]